MKKTKFIKRILNFFMPSKRLFIDMEWVISQYLNLSSLEGRKLDLCKGWIQFDKNFAQFKRGSKGFK